MTVQAIRQEAARTTIYSAIWAAGGALCGYGVNVINHVLQGRPEYPIFGTGLHPTAVAVFFGTACLTYRVSKAMFDKMFEGWNKVNTALSTMVSLHAAALATHVFSNAALGIALLGPYAIGTASIVAVVAASIFLIYGGMRFVDCYL